MKNSFTERLNKILPIITSQAFLEGKGLGNEISFYIFDYSPEEELEIRKHIRFLKNLITKQHPGIKLLHINLFKLIIDYLKDRNILDRSFSLEQKKGALELNKALKAPLKPENIVNIFKNTYSQKDFDLVIMDGVGGVWPLIRAHSLLNNLHPVMEGKPLVLFYPGHYDGQLLKLFGRIKSDHYYRAFPLAPDY